MTPRSTASLYFFYRQIQPPGWNSGSLYIRFLYFLGNFFFYVQTQLVHVQHTKSACIIVYSTVSVVDWIKPNSGKGCDASLGLCLKCLFCERSKYIPSLACPRLISADSQGRTHTYPAHRRPCPGGHCQAHSAHVPTTLCRHLLFLSFGFFYILLGPLLLRRQVIQSSTKRICTNKS